MMAVRAGARHATLAQRWLYLSLAAHEASRDAGFDATQVCHCTALSFHLSSTPTRAHDASCNAGLDSSQVGESAMRSCCAVHSLNTTACRRSLHIASNVDSVAPQGRQYRAWTA
jgi:hypothetical protein